MQPGDFDLVRDMVMRKSGIVLDKSKEYLIEARLSALAKKLGIATAEELVGRVRVNSFGENARAVVEAMTTNETSFFRDLYPFEALRKIVLPELIARRDKDKTLSIWCAAASTGQEPYTIAMTMREHFPQLQGWNISFTASDLSRDVLERAASGKYSQLEVNRGLPATLLVKYFKKCGGEWEISADLRKMVKFREINLLEAWPLMPALDLVFIRNVLIYFDQNTKRQIFANLRRIMRPEAFLFLGGAETTLNIDDNFERDKADKAGLYRLRSRVAQAA